MSATVFTRPDRRLSFVKAAMDAARSDFTDYMAFSVFCGAREARAEDFAWAVGLLAMQLEKGAAACPDDLDLNVWSVYPSGNEGAVQSLFSVYRFHDCFDIAMRCLGFDAVESEEDEEVLAA